MYRFLLLSSMLAAIGAPIAVTAAPQTGRALPADPVRAINVCMAASHPADPGGKIQLRDSIEAAWYLLEGLREYPQPGSLAERLSNFPSPDAQDAEVDRAEAPQLLNLCQQRWHNSHRGAIEIMLPIRRYDRDVECYAVISFVAGMLGNDRIVDDERLGRHVRTKMAYYRRQLDGRAFAAHGVKTDDEQDALLVRRTFDTLDLGNMNDVVDACLKAPD